MSKKSNITDWLNEGTKTEVFIKRVLVIGLMLLIFYKLGYGVGIFLTHIGL